MIVKSFAVNTTLLALVLWLSSSKICVGDQGSGDAKSSGMPLGPGILYPTASADLKYDDNILSDSGSTKASTITTLSVTGREEVADNLSRYTAELGLTGARYLDSPADSYTDVKAMLSAAVSPSQHLSGKVSGSFRRLHDDRGSLPGYGVTASSQLDPNIYNFWELKGNLGYGVEHPNAPRLDFDAGYQIFAYQNNRSVTKYRDQADGLLGATLKYMLMPATSLVATGQFKNVSYDKTTLGSTGVPDSLDSKEYSLLGGLMWKATAATTGHAKAGWAYKDFSSATRDSTGHFAWDIGVDWSPLQYSKFGLTTNRSFGESNGTGDFIDQRAIRVSWNNAWRTFLNSELFINHEWSKFTPSTRHDDTDSIGCKVNYQMDRMLTWSLFYTYTNRNSNAADSDYDRNQLGLKAELKL